MDIWDFLKNFDKPLTIFGVPPNRGAEWDQHVGPTRRQRFLTPPSRFKFSLNFPKKNLVKILILGGQIWVFPPPRRVDPPLRYSDAYIKGEKHLSHIFSLNIGISPFLVPLRQQNREIHIIKYKNAHIFSRGIARVHRILRPCTRLHVHVHVQNMLRRNM